MAENDKKSKEELREEILKSIMESGSLTIERASQPDGDKIVTDVCLTGLISASVIHSLVDDRVSAAIALYIAGTEALLADSSGLTDRLEAAKLMFAAYILADTEGFPSPDSEKDTGN